MGIVWKVSILVAAVVGGAVLVAPANAAVPSGSGLLHVVGRTVTATGFAAVDSDNWSGYAVEPGSGVTAVSGSWVVPTANAIPGDSGEWVGIGGATTSDLIQAGTVVDSLATNIDSAFYETLPNTASPVTGCAGDANCTVTAGDVISTRITEVGTNVWDLAMSSSGKDNWTWTKNNLAYTSTHSSAEWILEAQIGLPTPLVLAHLGTVSFSNATYGAGGATIGLGQAKPTEFILDQDPTGSLLPELTEATPGPVSGNGFLDCSWATHCP